MHRLSAETRRRLHALVPRGGAVAGPVNTTVAVAETSFRRCLELVAADAGVDAVLALVLPTAATGDLITALRAAEVGVPLAAVVLGQTETVRLLPRAADRRLARAAGWAGAIPAYADSRAAACALARAAAYGAWRARPAGQLPEFSDVKLDDARDLVRAFLAGSPQGGWLPPGEVTGLLSCYGIRLTGPAPAAEADDALSGAGRPGGPEVMIGVAQEPVFGPVVLLGPGDVGRDVPAGQAARLAPLTDTDADELIRSADLPRGYPDSPSGDPAALRETLLRVSRLADDLPEVAELDLAPVITRPDAMSVRGARIRLTPAQPHDQFLRKLL